MNFNKDAVKKAVGVGGVIVLAVIVLITGRELLLDKTPKSYAASENGSQIASAAIIKDNVQEVSIDLKPNSYAPIIVQKGIPVRLNIRADQKNINSCNGTVVIPEYNLEIDLKAGDNFIEFTPEKTGSISYSCWMGMVSSTIQIVDDLSKADLTAVPAPAVGGGLGGTCCQPR